MKIYTKTGDNLTTSTVNERVYKNDILIDISGTIDELQTHLMVAYNFIKNDCFKDLLKDICRTLFTVGYEISSKKNLIDESKVKEFEDIIDKYDHELKPLKEFILPGLSKGASFVHVSRAVARRLERLVVSYAIESKVNEAILQYLNRLSDLLFVIARYEEENNG